MNTTRDGWMTEAARLTRAGDLSAATALIRAALRGGREAATRGDTGVVDVEAREVASEGEPAASGPAAPPAGRFIAGSHAEAAGARDYKLYVPPGHTDGRARPLVVMLHGCKQDPDDFAAGTAMNDVALEHGFFVLYPAQSRNANPSGCWNWFKHNHQRRGKGEPALLAGMTRGIVERHGIDARRVYVAGLSAGGAMAAILGDAYPDVFAAVGVHSGLPTGSASDVPSAFAAMKNGSGASAADRSPPTIVFHGDRDATVHPANGEDVFAASALAFDAEIEPRRSHGGRQFTRRVCRDADGKVRAEHWTIHGGGHAWSGGSPQGSYTDANGPDASREMVRFFLAHEQPIAQGR